MLRLLDPVAGTGQVEAGDDLGRETQGGEWHDRGGDDEQEVEPDIAHPRRGARLRGRGARLASDHDLEDPRPQQPDDRPDRRHRVGRPADDPGHEEVERPEAEDAEPRPQPPLDARPLLRPEQNVQERVGVNEQELEDQPDEQRLRQTRRQPLRHDPRREIGPRRHEPRRQRGDRRPHGGRGAVGIPHARHLGLERRGSPAHSFPERIPRQNSASRCPGRRNGSGKSLEPPYLRSEDSVPEPRHSLLTAIRAPSMAFRRAVRGCADRG